jgi:hypothetical protein
MIARDYADKASGASNVLMGNDAGGNNRIGATGTQFLGAQAQSFLDSIGKQISAAYSKIGMLMLYQLVKNSDYIDYTMLDEADAALCKEVYEMNVEDLPTKFKFNATVTSIENTDQMRREKAGQVLGMYFTYGDKMAQIAGQLANPQLMQQAPRVAEVLSSYMVGATKMMEEILRSFDEGEVGDYLPYTGDLQEQLREADLGRDEQLQLERSQINTAGDGVQSTGGLPPDTGGVGGTGDVEAGIPVNGIQPTQVGVSTGAEGQSPVGGF